ncbi:Uma2 family endonuclease [Streptomyces sp. A7024]|uniref:Uma2 family endonuclease n=2 Tax=Streptomyces coryli TaxID=1128680 RepID=A0A6G4U0G5_9ACTN|nr:Uma2 family endonuclease [Streptomyces coryli]NGN65759.1 Uma2 family endonuclease [Streptomyces coryli]
MSDSADSSTAASIDEAFEALSAATPEGWRVELIEGEIHVVPPANGEHEGIVNLMVEQVVERRKDRRWTTRTGLGLLISGISPTGKVVPDLVIVPRGSYMDELEYHDPSEVVLVGEVTSRSTGASDRSSKLRGYARAKIPFYLLVDRDADAVSLYSEPSSGQYTREATVAMSKTIVLPHPLGFELDTSEF